MVELVWLNHAAGAVSSVGRAPARQAGGHWFEPSTAHSRKARAKRVFYVLARKWELLLGNRAKVRRAVAGRRLVTDLCCSALRVPPFELALAPLSAKLK